MNCSCRTTSLRIFVQSVTQVQLSGTALPPPARQIDPRQIAAYQPNGTVRSFTAASAACRLRRIGQIPAQHATPSRTISGAALQCPQDTAEQNVLATSELLHAQASIGDLEKARSDGAILDFSSESIDSLAAELRVESNEAISSPHGHDETDADSEVRSKSKPSLSGASRLKRTKIMPSNVKVSEETTELAPQKREPWQIQKDALEEKFPEGWQPRKRLSPDALDGIRALHHQYPEEFTTDVLAAKFEVSPEAIRRILKSKWRPSADEEIRRQERWFNRGKNIWSQMAALGKKPPKKWREEGIVRDPSWNRKRGPRTEYPYMPQHRAEADLGEQEEESTQRKIAKRLL